MLFSMLMAGGTIFGILSNFKKPDDWVIWPEYNELVFFLGFLPPIIYLAGAWGSTKHFAANWKSILARGFISNLISFVTVSLGAAYFLPKFGIDSLKTTDYLAIGAIFIPNNLVFGLPAVPFPEKERYEESSAIFGDGVFSIASSILLLKIIEGRDFSTFFINLSSMLLVLGSVCYVLVSSSMLGIFIGWLVSFHGLLAKMINITPEEIVDDDGYVVRGHERATYILLILTVPIFILAEFLNISGTLCVFFYAITTAHYLWPKVTEDSLIWRHDLHYPSSALKVFLHMWVGFAAGRMIQWSHAVNQPRAFFGVTCVLLTILLLARVISHFHLSQIGIKKTETIERTLSAMFLNRWKTNSFELETQVNIWVSSIMPGVVTCPLAYHQFGNAEETHKALIFSSILVIYLFTLLVFGLSHGRMVSSVSTILSIAKQSNLKLPSITEGRGRVQHPIH